MNTQTANGLQGRLSNIERLLESDPAAAEALVIELLQSHPGQQMALLFQGIARRQMGDPLGAIEVLEPLCDEAPNAPLAHLQLGLARRETDDREAAARLIRRAVEINSDFACWRTSPSVMIG